MEKNQFNELKSTRKGNVAENYVDDYLISVGYQTWMNTNKQSTPWDGFANKSNVTNPLFRKILIEVKLKYPFTDRETNEQIMSIHETDLEIYKQSEVDENRFMCIFYVDYKNKNLYMTSVKQIEKTKVKVELDPYDKKKNLVYFTGWKQISKVPDSIINKIKLINDEK